MRVALIKTGALGDVVRTAALVPGLKRLAPRLDLTWITAPAALDLVRHHPDVARAVTVDEPEDAPWRREAYDWVISLDDEAAMCRLASRLAARRLSGAHAAPDGALRYTDDVEPWFGMGILRPAERGGLARANELKRLNEETVATLLYRSLGLPLPLTPPAVHVPAEHLDRARRWAEAHGLGAGAAVVGLNSGAGGRWRFKSWGEDPSARLARRLHDEAGATVLVLGGAAEADRNARIVAAADRPRVLGAPTDLGLLDFTATIGLCDLLVTSDSLALHLAVAREVPVVAFFGPTSAAEIDLYGRGEKVVTPLACRCCYLRDCDVRPHCMQTIGIADLYEAARRWLPVAAGR